MSWNRTMVARFLVFCTGCSQGKHCLTTYNISINSSYLQQFPVVLVDSFCSWKIDCSFWTFNHFQKFVHSSFLLQDFSNFRLLSFDCASPFSPVAKPRDPASHIWKMKEAPGSRMLPAYRTVTASREHHLWMPRSSCANSSLLVFEKLWNYTFFFFCFVWYIHHVPFVSRKSWIHPISTPMWVHWCLLWRLHRASSWACPELAMCLSLIINLLGPLGSVVCVLPWVHQHPKVMHPTHPF